MNFRKLTRNLKASKPLDKNSGDFRATVEDLLDLVEPLSILLLV